jgi:hypothetical protein
LLIALVYTTAALEHSVHSADRNRRPTSRWLGSKVGGIHRYAGDLWAGGIYREALIFVHEHKVGILSEIAALSSGESVLSDAIASGVPIVALLGQGAGWPEGHDDPILALALAKAKRTGESWRALLSREPLPTAFYEWLAERFSRRAPSENLLSLTEMPLSAAYTSSIDPGIANLLATNGRNPEPVLVGDPVPPITRSRRRPPVYYLFGRAGGGAADFQPPVAIQSLGQRRLRHSSAMLRSLNEAATAVGLIVVDGYRPESDWLKPEDLLAVMGGSAKGGVLWCGPEPVFSEDDQEIYDGLLTSGVIIREGRSLGELSALLRVDGYPSISQQWDDPELVSLAGGKTLVTTARLRLATQASATILDDSLTGFLAPLSPSMELAAFRSFHSGGNGIRGRVEGIRREFAIIRDFETALSKRVNQALSHHHLEKGAIILHGQSGVGKSVALARLAAVIRQQGQAAVLVASERMVQPVEVSEFLAEVDRLGAVTLLIVDVTLAPSRFDELLIALRSRGHRVVVVGSSYRIEDGAPNLGAGQTIYAPEQLSTNEQAALVELAVRYSAGSIAGADQPHALARFYWSIPESRERLSAGLGREARDYIAGLRSRGMTRKPITALGSLGAAFVDAGYPEPSTTLLQDDGSGTEDIDVNNAAEQIVARVMAVSRVYKSVPVNLLLRSLVNASLQPGGGISIDLIRDLFLIKGIFDWHFADEEGEELLVRARLQIEAELICNRLLGGPLGEANRVVELIASAYRAGPENNEETRFLAEVVYAMGPDGPFPDRYKDSYADIARALTTLRERYNVVNARLMLQEATLRRHYIRTHDITRDHKAILLDEASRAVEEALQLIAAGGSQRIYASNRTKDFLWVERAATYGYLATDSATSGDSPEKIWSNYLAARNAARMASGRVDSYYPLDIALWAPRDILRDASNLRVVDKAELESDIRSTLDAVELSNLPPSQAESFQKQRLSLSYVLKDTALGDEAFAELAATGSLAGYYLRARALAPNRPDVGDRADQGQIEAAASARDYLRSNYPTISADIRCLTLLLNCDWTASSGRWLFRGTRQPLPTSAEAQMRCRGVLLDIFNATVGGVSPRFKYLDNVLNWLTGDENEAIARWRELARETEYIEQSRVVSRHTVTDTNGAPKIYSGLIERQIGPDRWSVFIPDLRRRVDLVEAQSGRDRMAIGQQIRDFAVSFNYIGPIVDYVAARSRQP